MKNLYYKFNSSAINVKEKSTNQRKIIEKK